MLTVTRTYQVFGLVSSFYVVFTFYGESERGLTKFLNTPSE